MQAFFKSHHVEVALPDDFQSCNLPFVYVFGGAFRLTFPSENELDSINMVEYDESGTVSGLMHFTRKPK